jgi:hypothetical protein
MTTLELVIVVLAILWLLGAWVVPTGGSLVHVLLVICLVLLALRLFQGRQI